MPYDLLFTRTGRSALGALERTERTYVQTKLAEISACEFRHPTQWDFQRLPGAAQGRLRVGDGLRVFVDIDEEADVIRIHDVRRRENLYA